MGNVYTNSLFQVILLCEKTTLIPQQLNRRYHQNSVFFLSTTYWLSLVDLFFRRVGIPVGTNCEPLLAVVFLYSLEPESIQNLLKEKKKHLAKFFNVDFSHLDVILSLNYPQSQECLLLILPGLVMTIRIYMVQERGYDFYFFFVVDN